MFCQPENVQFDRIDLDINAPANDEFNNSDSDEEGVQILPRSKSDDKDDIDLLPEVIEKLKSHPMMQKYISDAVDKRISDIMDKKIIERENELLSNERENEL